MTQHASTLPAFESTRPARPATRAGHNRDRVLAQACASLFWAAFVLLTFGVSRITL